MSSGQNEFNSDQHPDHIIPYGRLRTGTRIPTMRGLEVHILRYIGGGGQGDVYEVAYGGERKALKWYHRGVFLDQKSFIENLIKNIKTGSPEDSFVWPLDITDYYDGTFGYVMELIPGNYVEVDDLLLNNVRFSSYRRVIDACINTVNSFRFLHNKGYSYQDINTGNLLIDSRTGKVLICDNDNVAPNNVSTGVLGTLGFMAPEIINGRLPNEVSDLYSLSVLIFLLLFRIHPLEGKRSLGSMLTDEEKLRLYATDALFVFDGNDSSNCLDASDPKHAWALDLWKSFPSHFKEFLCRAFSQDSLKRAKRPIEAEWLNELTKLRSETLVCSNCGNELFYDRSLPMRCDCCGTSLVPRMVLCFGKNLRHVDEHSHYLIELPVAYDTRLYKTQLRTCHIKEAPNVEALVVREHGNNEVYGIQNLSQQPWHVHVDGEEDYEIPSGSIGILQPGLKIVMQGTEVAVKPFS